MKFVNYWPSAYDLTPMGEPRGKALPKLDVEIGQLLIELMELMKQHFFTVATELDLTPTQAIALHSLGEPCPMRELAEAIGHDASHITSVVDRLEAQGLVERRVDPKDRRVKLLSLTPAGWALQERIEHLVTARLQLVDRELTLGEDRSHDAAHLAGGSNDSDAHRGTRVQGRLGAEEPVPDACGVSRPRRG